MFFSCKFFFPLKRLPDMETQYSDFFSYLNNCCCLFILFCSIALFKLKLFFTSKFYKWKSIRSKKWFIFQFDCSPKSYLETFSWFIVLPLCWRHSVFEVVILRSSLTFSIYNFWNSFRLLFAIQNLLLPKPIVILF